MSKFFKAETVRTGDLTDMVADIERHIDDYGQTFIGEDLRRNVIGVEGVTDTATMNNVTNEMGEVANFLRSQFENAGIALTSAQVEAGAIAAAAAIGDPLAYHSAAVGVEGAKFSTDVNVIEVPTGGSFGSFVSTDTVGVEAFEERELRNCAAYSTVYNIAASKQDPFAEAFYKTVVLSPDQVGIEMSVKCTVVHREIRRNGKGKPTDFKKINLLEAPLNHTILENRATDVVPFINTDNSVDHCFVDKTLVIPYVTKVDGVDVRTAPLAFGANFDLLELSQTPGLMNGQIFDHTDMLDTRVAVKNLYLQLSNPAGDVRTAVKIPTTNMSRSAFNKSTEGGSNEMELNFRTDTVFLSEKTVDITGAAATELFGEIGGYRLYYKTTIGGTTDLETAETSLTVSRLVLDSATLADETGTAISLTDPALVAALAKVKVELVGYDLEAYRTNTNLRTRSLMLDTVSEKEGYKVRLGAPITITAPLIGHGRTGVDVKSLIATTRTKTANDAVTALLNFMERLKNGQLAVKEGRPAPAVEGIARHIIRPTYVEKTLDIEAIVDSVRSADKAEDIMVAIVETLRHTVYKMIVDSNFRTALDFDTAGGNARPKVIIGTDPITARYMYESGDGRTLANGIDEADFEIVTSPDERMKNKIIIALSRTGGKENDPLSFGVHAYVPELLATVETTRFGAMVKENQVQPRNLHINNVPVAGMINVLNLEKVINSKIARKNI